MAAKTDKKGAEPVSGKSTPIGGAMVRIAGHDVFVAKGYMVDEHEIKLPAHPAKAIKIQSCYDRNVQHTIQLSEVILNIDEQDIEQAYWKRQFVPKFFHHYIPGKTELFADETFYNENGLLAALSDEDTRELLYFFDREMHRREHGVWMKQWNPEMKCFELQYLTGDHYFTLQWCKMYGVTDKNIRPWRDKGFKYGEFRIFQRDVFYLIQKVNIADHLLGLYICKPKKTGISQVFACYYLNKSTKEAEQQMGIMSKGKDAFAVNMLMYFHALDGLPHIFKPSIRDRGDVSGNIFFGEAMLKSIRTKKSMERLSELQNSNPLNTKVYAAKTKEAGFDSPTMTDIWFDEFPKYDTENDVMPEVVWERNKRTVQISPSFNNGRAWFTSYPPEYDKPGFMQAKDLYNKSKLSTITDTSKGRTASGLICMTISALFSYFEHIDRYGYCDMKVADDEIEAERAKVKDNRQKLQSVIRQYPKNEREAWGSTGAGSTFDNILLGEVLEEVERNKRGLEEGTTGREYVEGHHEWTKDTWEWGAKDSRPKKTFAPVKWVPLDALQTVYGEQDSTRYYTPVEQIKQNKALSYGYDDEGNLMGPLQHEVERVCGIDPTSYADSAEVITGSKNACVAMTMPDMLEDNRKGGRASKIIYSTYLWRHDTADHFYEDVVKKIIFEGCVVVVEANREWLATRLIHDGLGRWMIVKDKRDNNRLKFWQPWVMVNGKREEMDYGLVRGDADYLETIVQVISKYIQRRKEGEGESYAFRIRDERLLDQMMNFSKERSKFYDLVMAFGWCLICMSAVLDMPVEEVARGYEQDIMEMVWGALMNG